MIDLHHHIVPRFYVAENRDRIVAAGSSTDLKPLFYRVSASASFGDGLHLRNDSRSNQGQLERR